MKRMSDIKDIQNARCTEKGREGTKVECQAHTECKQNREGRQKDR